MAQLDAIGSTMATVRWGKIDASNPADNTVADLKKFLKQNGIIHPSKAKKAEYVSLVEDFISKQSDVPPSPNFKEKEDDAPVVKAEAANVAEELHPVYYVPNAIGFTRVLLLFAAGHFALTPGKAYLTMYLYVASMGLDAFGMRAQWSVCLF